MVDPEQTLNVWWSGWRQSSPAGLDRELEGLQRPFWLTDGTRSAVHGWLSLSATRTGWESQALSHVTWCLQFLLSGTLFTRCRVGRTGAVSPGDSAYTHCGYRETSGRNPQDDFWKILLPQLLYNLADFPACVLRPWDFRLSS